MNAFVDNISTKELNPLSFRMKGKKKNCKATRKLLIILFNSSSTVKKNAGRVLSLSQSIKVPRVVRCISQLELASREAPGMSLH